MRGVFVLVLGLLGWTALTVAHEAKHEQHEERLPTIGAAPDFALISQDVVGYEPNSRRACPKPARIKYPLLDLAH
jgi:hypothetical protein